MRQYERGEYYDYTYPEPLKKETPETKKRLQQILNEMDEMATRHHKEAKEMNRTE